MAAVLEMPVPCGFEDAPPGPSSSSASGGYDIPAGVWVMTTRIHENTFVTTAEVPYFNRDAPVSGTKPARETLMAVIKGANGGRVGMGFREPLERDKVTPDVYFKYAPGWSNMGYSVATGGACPRRDSRPCRAR